MNRFSFIATGATSSAGLKTAATALAANAQRKKLRIQNQGTNKLYVKYGAGASTSDYDEILKANTGAADGTSAPLELDAYVGVVTVAGTSPSYTATEFI